MEYQATKAEAERAEKMATEVRGESLSIYSDVKLLTIPDIDTEKLYDQATEIKSDVGTCHLSCLNIGHYNDTETNEKNYELHPGT